MEKLYFEDYFVGEKLVSPGRTITETDIVQFAAFTGDWHPLHWTRVRAGSGLERAECERRLRADGMAVRYLASAQVGSQRLAPAVLVRQGKIRGALSRRRTVLDGLRGQHRRCQG